MADHLYEILVHMCETFLASKHLGTARRYDILLESLMRAKKHHNWEYAREPKDGTTLLMWLVRRPSLNPLTFMVMRQTNDVLVIDTQGDNVLHHAVDSLNPAAVMVLCDITRHAMHPMYYRNFVDELNHEGSCALTFAVHHQDAAMLRLLFDKGCHFPLVHNAINLLHEASDWDSNLEIFIMLVQELENKDYDYDFVEHYVNEATTFCDEHETMHNLWDYLVRKPDARWLSVAMGLVRGRGLREPRILFSISAASKLKQEFLSQ
jgi:hypothetical protein